MTEPQCELPAQHAAPKDRLLRLKKLEEFLRNMDPEDGYDWPEMAQSEVGTRRDQ
jgi:hypothetical protein